MYLSQRTIPLGTSPSHIIGHLVYSPHISLSFQRKVTSRLLAHCTKSPLSKNFCLLYKLSALVLPLTKPSNIILLCDHPMLLIATPCLLAINSLSHSWLFLYIKTC